MIKPANGVGYQCAGCLRVYPTPKEQGECSARHSARVTRVEVQRYRVPVCDADPS